MCDALEADLEAARKEAADARKVRETWELSARNWEEAARIQSERAEKAEAEREHYEDRAMAAEGYGTIIEGAYDALAEAGIEEGYLTDRIRALKAKLDKAEAKAEEWRLAWIRHDTQWPACKGFREKRDE